MFTRFCYFALVARMSGLGILYGLNISDYNNIIVIIMHSTSGTRMKAHPVHTSGGRRVRGRALAVNCAKHIAGWAGGHVGGLVRQAF